MRIRMRIPAAAFVCLYGITTVNSLGGDEAAGLALRDEQYRADLTGRGVCGQAGCRKRCALRDQVNRMPTEAPFLNAHR